MGEFFNPADITSPFTATPVKICDVDGTGNMMTFAQIASPSIDPEFTYTRNLKVSRSRPSATDPGYRIFGSFGSSSNLKDLILDLPLIDSSQYAQLKTYSNGRPGVFKVSIDGGANWNYCMFKENGLQPKNYRFNQRAFLGVKLDLHLIY